MKKFFVIIVCILCLSLCSEREKEPFSQKNIEKYLAGIKYLNAAENLSASEKKAYYKKLVDITGVSATIAKNFINEHGNHPEKWKEVLEHINELINATEKE